MFRAELDPLSTPTLLLKHDEEYHTSWWGHTGHLGLTSHVILPNYAGYANTPAASLFPDNATIEDLAHAQSGPLRLRASLRSARARSGRAGSPDERLTDRRRSRQGGLPRGRWLQRPQDHGGSLVSPAQLRLPPPGRLGHGRDDELRVAARPGGHEPRVRPFGAKLDYRGWLAALKAGRTFVSNGPVVSFSIDGKEPGDEISLPAGTRRLTAKVSLRSIVRSRSSRSSPTASSSRRSRRGTAA